MNSSQILLLLSMLTIFGKAFGASLETGAFEISSIVTTPASTCSAADGSITLTIDPSAAGTSPYDVSLDNGETWVENNLTPNVAGEITVTNQAWGTYVLAVRDASSAVVYPGYAHVTGCTRDIGAFRNPTFSISTVDGATGYDWTTSVGAISAGQNTISATFDFSNVVHNTLGSICVQPTGPSCDAPPTCFEFRIVATETSCTDGIDNDGDGLVDCADCVECAEAASCGDTDGDGIGDFCDLDDDNDGIPDAVECFPNELSRDGFLTADSYNFTGGDGNGDQAYLNSLTIDGIEFTNFIVPDNYSSNFADLSSVSANQIWIVDNNVKTSDYTSAADWNSDALNAFQDQNMNHYQYIARSLQNGVDYFEVSYDSPVFVNQNLFIAFSEREGNNSVILEGLDINGNAIGPQVTVATTDYQPTGVNVDPSNVELYLAILPLDDLAPIGSLIYTVRVYDNHGSSDAADGKVFIFGEALANCVDTDGDGVEDYLDLDSDNDGIYDLDEAGHSVADVNEDGVIDGAPSLFGANGLFNGLETSVESGELNYSVADSENTPDGIFDAYTLDSDGDGCLDATEESVTDPDDDGIAGIGATSVNSDGLVTGNSYARPTNNTWQNASSSNCLAITGRVFEDVNYGGGAGRSYTVANTSAQSSSWASGAIGVESARVELYSSTGAFLSATNTDASGDYSFENLLPQNYQIRFVTRSISSNRGSNSTGLTALSVPTFRSVGATSYTAEIGGVDPTKEDAEENTTSQNISALSSVGTVAQAVSLVDGSSGDLSNVDLGVSFNVISNKNNTGIGSLRQFILNSNELNNINLDQEDSPAGRSVLAKALGEDVSIFEIAGTGPHTILPSTVLPDLEDPYTHLSGYTQLGSVQGKPESRTIAIGIDGGGRDGLLLDASNLTVSGLAIYGCDVAIEFKQSGASNSQIWGNYIGLEEDGLTTATNAGTGIYVYQQSSAFIGTNGDGANDLSEGNVVSNSYEGIIVRGSSNVLVTGNYIGLDHTGQSDQGNRFRGVFVRDCSARNVIGLDDNISTLTGEAARNVCSGNGADGIRIFESSNQVIAGNFIGSDRLGMAPIENVGFGLQFIGETSSNQVGTDSDNINDVEEGNVISGNGGGIRFSVGGTGADNWIAGNFVGVDVTGNVALPNNANGITLDGSQTNTIVGTNGDGTRDIIERNVISGNKEDGIRVSGLGGNLISGNFIGVGADRSTYVPNEKRGILVPATSSNNVFGYRPGMMNTNSFEVGNVIRANNDTGIAFSGTGVNNTVRRNSFGDNGTLAIDLDYDGVSTNDNGDNDSGANKRLNYPVIRYTKFNGTTLQIRGFAPANSLVEFYLADAGPNPSPLPSGFTSSFGEGMNYLGTAIEGGAEDSDSTTGTYTNDGSGSTTLKTEHEFSFDFPVSSLASSVNVGDILTAIAIDSDGNTSEFSGVTSIRFIEICSDLIDNDGDGLVDCEDDDCPGVGVVSTVNN